MKDVTRVMLTSRPSWEEWAMGLAFASSIRADCRRSQVGAVVLDSAHRVIATGYNGTKPGEPGCLAGQCPRGLKNYDQVPASDQNYDVPGSPGYCIAVHAEMNAVLASDPLRMNGGLLAVTHKPCNKCMRQIRVTPLARVIWPIKKWEPQHWFGLALGPLGRGNELITGENI